MRLSNGFASVQRAVIGMGRIIGARHRVQAPLGAVYGFYCSGAARRRLRGIDYCVSSAALYAV
jgi:hypothetical protein